MNKYVGLKCLGCRINGNSHIEIDKVVNIGRGGQRCMEQICVNIYIATGTPESG